ncbi:MAG: RHS repeat protein [Theionarchaea archaeon]|nr:RHS repeat protein [Theionarchaea archaeon]
MKMRDVGTVNEVLRISKVTYIGAILFMGLLFNVQLLAGMTDIPSEEIVFGSSLDRLRHVTLQDGVYGIEENYGYTESPSHEPLQVHSSSNQDYEYMANSPYYTAFFDGQTMRMEIGETWIELELVESDSGEVQAEESDSEDNTLSVSGVFSSVDMEYEVDTSLLTERLVLSEFIKSEWFIYEISWDKMTPEYTETGSLLFSSDGNPIVEILAPFMKDDRGSVCTDVHYDLVETETGYELHKVIDASGQEWLRSAQYPVVIDPSMQTFEDAWESSGLTPYGQYFRNLKEFVNPANGLLTITQTDLVIPGRSLNVNISRVYQTPAVFYGSSPYDYEAPPVDLGKGWSLDFPYVGTKYLHLWGGTAYKISWVSNTFENHVGSHFTLVKNGNNTYTLTMASGTVYEFDTSGKLTQIRDIDGNSIDFTYQSGILTTITDTIGRTLSLSYSSGRLWKITYNSAELEYSYDGNGCLQWMDDFLDRRTSYYYNSGYNYWLLSQIAYATTGYTTYSYDRFSDNDYYKYYVTDQRVYETSQVRHMVFSYTGTLEAITSSVATVKNESDTTKGSNHFTINSSGLITEQITKDESATPIRKYTYTYNSQKAVTQSNVYNDGSTLSYTTYFSYDNWGNITYTKNAEGHETFFSYSNTNGSGFFMDNTGAIKQTFTNKFSNSTVPSSVHTALIGMAEKQDSTYVKEVYVTYDGEAHPTESDSLFGNYTSYQTFSGTFNENTSSTSFPVDLTGYSVAGNAILQITGLASDPTYSEVHSYTPNYGTGCHDATWTLCSWQSSNYKTYYTYSCGVFPDVTIYQGWAYIGPFTHYPNTLGYQGCSTNPSCNQQSHSFSVTAYWKAYPAQVQYDVNESNWKLISSNLKNTTAQVAVTGLTNGENTLYFTESSAQNTKFSWALYVPVDNSPDTYTTSMQYDTYGNVTSITDAESNNLSLTYSATYSYAYLTEISATVGQDTITSKATYDSNRGWITSIQQPEGVSIGSGYDYLFTYDLLGRVTKKEFPLLSGQAQRSYIEAIFDDTNRKITIIDQLRHHIVQEYDRLGRLQSSRWYTGTYGSGTLYATVSYAWLYNDLISTVTNPLNQMQTYTYDFLGRALQISYPDSSSVSWSYDDSNNKVTLTNGRGYDKIGWFNWLGQLVKVEEEYTADTFATTTYQYNEVGNLTSFTDAESHTTSYTYTSLFGVTRITYPDSTWEEYQYNNVGNVTSLTDAEDNETTITYDSLNRLLQVQYQDTSTVTVTYDLNSNVVRMDDDAISTGDYTENTYDSWERIISETRHISIEAYIVSYQYDIAGRLIKLTYPDTMEITYSYDDLNRITDVKRYVDGSNDEIILDNVQYNVESLLTQVDYGNDLRATFSYDSRDRISTIDLKNGETFFLDLDYTYDNNSNITQLANAWRDTSDSWHSNTESYSYDGLDRLTSASCTSWSHTYSYDKTGNRIGKDGITYTVNSVNEVTALSNDTSFSYNSNGNMTERTTSTDSWVYTYDYANRLTGVEKNSATLGEYKYDGIGRRLQVAENGVTTRYIYFGANVLYEENSNGSASYIYGPTGRIAKRTTIQGESNIFYYHTDHIGSTRQITDNDKNIVAAITYHPFGEACIEEGSEDYLFSGQERDITGLYYCGARYYDPEIGRFITRDPFKGMISNPQSLNGYSYCQNNPVRYVDPMGLDRTLHDIGNPGSSYNSEEKEEEEKEDDGGGGEGEGEQETPHTLPYGDDELLVLRTPVQRSGNVGVAVAELWTLDENGFYNTQEGLAIIYYDNDGNIADYVFISFDDFVPVEDERPVGVKTAMEFLDKHDIDPEDFAIAIDALQEFCHDKELEYENKSSLRGLLVGGASGILGILSFIGKKILFAYFGLAGAIAGLGYTVFSYIYYRHMESIWDRRGNAVPKAK